MVDTCPTKCNFFASMITDVAIHSMLYFHFFECQLYVDEGKKCHQMCDLDAFTFQLKNETSQVIAKGHSDCATKISSLAARLEQPEEKREQLENARAIVKGFTQEALADISDPVI